MLLREMIRRVTELGYRQVTLHTWAGNMKAVPLYKKTGFNWVPETEVFMRNFLPGILQMGLVQELLGDRDWYECMEREIVVAPDDLLWHGMKVYRYQFRNGERSLTLYFDEAGEGLTGIETDTFSASSYLACEEAPAGQSYDVGWEIVSKSGKSLDVVLLAEGETGLNLRAQQRLTVQDRATLVHSVEIPVETRPTPEGYTARRIRSTLVIDGATFTLETGVKVVRPVEIEVVRENGHVLIPGRTTRVPVRLRSRLDHELTGTMALVATASLSCAYNVQPFVLPAKGWTQVLFDVTGLETGVVETLLTLEAAHSSPLKIERVVAFHVAYNGECLGSIDPVEETASLEGQGVRALFKRRGGSVSLSTGSGTACLELPAATLGPPFPGEELRPELFDVAVQAGATGDRLVITGRPHNMPGLELERTLSIIGDGLVRLDHSVVNLTGNSRSTKVRIRSWSELNGDVTLPLQEGIVRQTLQGLQSRSWGGDDLFPARAVLGENWVANEEDGSVGGLLFSGSPDQNREWTQMIHLTYDLSDIGPYQRVQVPTLYAVVASGSWERVRSEWKSRVQTPAAPHEEAPEVHGVLEIELGPTLFAAESQEVKLSVKNRRTSSLSGKLTLAGDNVTIGDNFDFDGFELVGVNHETPFEGSVVVSLPAPRSAQVVTVGLESHPVPETRKRGLVRLGEAGSVEVREEQGGHIRVDNGWLSFEVVPEYLGSMISLERGGVNHLRSGYPELRPFRWANPWHGGLHPFLGWMADVRLTRELFTGAALEVVGTDGIVWRGVRVCCTPKHKDLSWMRVEADYLTTAGSNVLALVTRCVNLSGAAMQTPAPLGIGAWFQVGGTYQNAVVHAEHEGERQIRRRGKFSHGSLSGRWKAVENPEIGQIALMIAGSKQSSAILEDFDTDGAHLALRQPVSLQPNETKEYLGWLVLGKSASEIDAYVMGLSSVKKL